MNYWLIAMTFSTVVLGALYLESRRKLREALFHIKNLLAIIERSNKTIVKLGLVDDLKKEEK